MGQIEIIASILGGLVSGLFTFLGVFMTIKYQQKKDKRDESIRQNEKKQSIIDNRPRLEIIDYTPEHIYAEDFIVDLSVLMVCIKGYQNIGRACFEYDPLTIQPEKWVSTEYVMKNIGRTEIDHLYVNTNLPKNTSIFNVSTQEYVQDYKNKFLNYSVILDKSLKPQETFKLQICYISDKIVESNFGCAPLALWLIDVNKNYWRQNLFSPYSKIYNSELSSHKKFREADDIETAIKCFEDPMLW